VVVVVTHDPDPERFDQVLAALAVQDHPNYRVLIVDTGSEVDPTDRVVAALPDARVLRLPAQIGFGTAANCVLDVVEGAAFYVFAHDDVAPEPDAISELVDAARAWDAAIVGPKLVDWNDPRRLRQVGVAVDRVGTTMPFAEPGELDQAQHDGLREVVTVPGAFTLVDAGLFERIGGYDEAITFLNDDLSLCWRARVAGARVLVASSAKVRHAEGFRERVTPEDRRRLLNRHRLRALLTCYGPVHLVLVLPAAIAMSLGDVLRGIVTGRPGRARDAAGAWMWNLRRLRSLRVARRHVHAIRRVPDRRIRRLQVQGLIGPRLQLRRVGGEARMEAARREAGAGEGPGSGVPAAAVPTPAVAAAAAAARSASGAAGNGAPVAALGPGGPAAGTPVDDERAGWTPGTVVASLALAATLLFGSRHLLTRFVPSVGEMVPFDTSGGTLLAEWASGWRSTGLGSETASPTLVGVVGALASLLGGQIGLIRTVLTLGLVPVGIVGAHRLLRPTGSRRTQVAAAVAYAALPVPYNALSGGHWSALAAYAGAPWLLSRLARALGDAPFRPVDAPMVVAPHSLRRHVLAVGATTAAVGLLVPVAPLLVLVMGAALALGSLLAFRTAGVGRLAVAAAGGAGLALLLHLPTTLDMIRSGDRIGAWLGVERPSGVWSALDLLRFETGPFGSSPVGFALLVAAAAPLFFARSWRFEWAVRGWVVAGAFWVLVLAQQEGWLSLPMPHPDVLLAPAGAGLALAAGLGVAAIEEDLRGRSRRFGLRRAAAAAGAVGLVVAATPVVGGTVDGWWETPHGDFEGVLGFVSQEVAEVPSRVLWIGDAEVLPGGAGWEWRDGVSYATSVEGERGVRDLWPGAEEGATRRIAEALDIAADRRTTRLGRLLAPMAVQYIAVPSRAAPSPFTDELRPVPPEVLTALGGQLDLEQIQVDPAVTLYRNTAFSPSRALVADATPLEAIEVEALQGADLSQSFPVLPDQDGVAFEGTLPAGFTMVQADASGRWRLSVDGSGAERTEAYGWAQAFDTGSGGDAVLSYRASPLFRLLLLVQVALWLVVIGAVLRMRFAGEAPAARPLSGAPGEGDPDATTREPRALGPGDVVTAELPPAPGDRRPAAGTPSSDRELVRGAQR
jgi:GT2 family glycosyltransferase